MEDAGIEPATSRMQSERSATELNPLYAKSDVVYSTNISFYVFYEFHRFRLRIHTVITTKMREQPSRLR
jgi:hypothetical protein